MRIEIGPDGIANVQHHLRYRVVAGRFKTLDLVGIDPRAELAPDTVLTPEKGGNEVAAHVETTKTPGTVRIVIDDPKHRGLTRGAYVADVKYRLDLVSTKMLTRDGAMWKLAWTAPPAPEGHDGARVVIDVPAAPTEPRLASSNEATTTLVTLRRGTERDELELVRPHVARGDAVVWAARLDPKAFPRVTTPELRPPPPVETTPPSLLASNLARVLVAVGFAAIAGVLSMLLRSKRATVRDEAAARGLVARPVVALPWGLGPFVYGVVTTGALAALLWWSPIGGAALVMIAMALAAHRAPGAIVKPRSPGAWQSVSDPAVLVPKKAAPTSALDLGATKGKIVFALFLVAVGVAAFFLRVKVPQIAIALPLVACAVVPVWLTGTRAQMPPAPVDLAARMLRPARDMIASSLDLAHVELGTIGRVTTGAGAAIDEVRLAGAPKDKTPGLRAIELALATAPGSWGASPEVLVRFDARSPAAKRIDALAAGSKVLRGRADGENVVRLVPEEPTAGAAAALVARLLVSLEGRRATDRNAPAPPFRGRDRRALQTPAMC
ncbi:MAG: hypothetical protein KIT84_43405 [Labilithrix sp.]|nr:hypothetical protein [Labilithrix sp.]MCW5817926.1 hypothetical protein [Labilithrix sp.]